MISRKMLINSVFVVLTIFVFFLLAKLLLLGAGLAFVIDQQMNSVTTGFFLVGGFLCPLYVIHKDT